MNAIIDQVLHVMFYIFPMLILLLGGKFKPNFEIFPLSIRIVDLITPYLLLSVAIQTKLARLGSIHFYFYIFLNLFGIACASYFVFVKRELLLGQFFRTWWRYTFIFSFLYHFIIGGYGIYLNFF